MLATAGRLPTGEQWAFEMKWDGVRVLVSVHDGKVALRARSGRDVTATYPELTGPDGLAAVTGASDIVLDGEVVSFDSGAPSFGQLQARMNVARPTPALIASVPVTYVVFDLLGIDGHDTFALPWSERRRQPVADDPARHHARRGDSAADRNAIRLAVARESGVGGQGTVRCFEPRRGGGW